MAGCHLEKLLNRHSQTHVHLLGPLGYNFSQHSPTTRPREGGIGQGGGGAFGGGRGNGLFSKNAQRSALRPVAVRAPRTAPRLYPEFERFPDVFFFFTLVTGSGRSLSLELSDTRVYEPMWVWKAWWRQLSQVLGKWVRCSGLAPDIGATIPGLRAAHPT